MITGYDFNNLVSYKANPDYKGLLGKPKTDEINVKYYADSSNLKLEIQQGDIDVAIRSLAATDIEDLRGDDNVKVVDGPPGGEIRYITFNFDTQPYGTQTAEADPAKALAVRQAVADLIDRQELSDQVYKHVHAAVLVRRGGPDRRQRGAQGPLRRRQGWPPRRRQGEGDPLGRRRHHARQAEPAVLERPLRPVVG